MVEILALIGAKIIAKISVEILVIFIAGLLAITVAHAITGSKA